MPLYIKPILFGKVEMNPIWQQKKLREYCKEKGVHFSAFSPLGAVGTNWGHNRVMENEVLKQIAKAKGKTVAQVIHNSFSLFEFEN